MGKWLVDVRFCCMICNFKSREGKAFKFHECYKRSAEQDVWGVDPRFKCRVCKFQTFELNEFCDHECVKKSLTIQKEQHLQEFVEELEDFTEEIGSGKRKVQCKLCHKHLANNTVLADHINAVHRNKKRYQCEKCLMKFGYKSNLNRHLRNGSCTRQSRADDETAEKSPVVLSDTETGELNTSKDRYESGKRNQQCHICHKNVGHGTKMSDHINAIHLNIKRHKCEKCSMTFGFRADSFKHSKKCTGTQKETRKYKCDLCQMNNFESEESLQKHQASLCLNVNVKKETESPKSNKKADSSHIKKAKRTCEYCGFIASQDYKYNDHVNSVHKGLKLNKCEKCLKSFGYRSGLRKHQKVCQATHIVPIEID